MNRRLCIAIDGPAGSGKSTVAEAVAERLGYRYISTGDMYRAVTLKAVRKGIDLEGEPELGRLAREISIEIVRGDNGRMRVLLDGEDVSETLRGPLINTNVSLVARVPEVRRVLVDKQREMAMDGGVVMEGRDIGTVVLPNADKKFYLTASVEERARRRYLEMKQRGFEPDPEALKVEIKERDRIDSERPVSPLKAAPDAIVIDTTEKSVDQVVREVLDEIEGIFLTDAGHLWRRDDGCFT